MAKAKITSVPTNIITGFLGVGKTSAILHLLKSKPDDERWAVLVNEFGEIGVDGSLFEGQHKTEQGVFVREVPGGCMCCAAGLPMQIALNTLLSQAKPHRLLVEPTGLGHPAEVVEVLSGKYYKEVLSLEKVLTLVDARNLKDERYTSHETFVQQIAIADCIVGNKSDLYQEGDRENLEKYIKANGAEHAQIVSAEHGKVELALLEGKTRSHPHHHHHHDDEDRISTLAQKPIPECGYLKAENQGEGFYSVGWRFDPYQIFDKACIDSFIKGLKVERIKGVFITEEGIFAYNMSSDTTTEIEINDCLESRIEIIATEIDESWQQELLNCIVAKTV